MNKNRADELSNDKNHEVSYIYSMYNATKYPIAGLGILGLGYYIGSNFGSNQGFIHNFIAKYIGRSEAYELSLVTHGTLAKEYLKLALNSWDFSYLGPSISNFSSALGYAALSTGSEIADLISKNSPPAKIIEKPVLLSEASKAIEHFTDLFSHNTVKIIVVTQGPGYFDPGGEETVGCFDSMIKFFDEYVF